MASSEKKKSANKKTVVKKTSKKKAPVKKAAVKKSKPVDTPVVKSKSVEKKTHDKGATKAASEVKVKPQEFAQENDIVVLKSTLAINEAAQFHKTLVELSDAGKPIVFDVSGVDNIDTAIFQLLHAFVTSIKSSGVSLTWLNPSEAFIERADILGLTESLDIPKVSA